MSDLTTFDQSMLTALASRKPPAAVEMLTTVVAMDGHAGEGLRACSIVYVCLLWFKRMMERERERESLRRVEGSYGLVPKFRR